VPSKNIQEVYDRADFLMNLSDLESFSNNYMEAWKAGLPLICSNTDFARHICADSAVYVNQHDPATAADEIIALLRREDEQKRLADKGKLYLGELPTIQQKMDQVMQVIRQVV
jgi:glycosyltransferase involved in cell wall biosynthesis